VSSQRARLIGAMVELSAKSGFQQVSILDLCTSAGVSAESFYEQFGDKEVLLTAAYRACSQEMLSSVRAAIADAEDALLPRVALAAVLEWVARDPAGGRVLFVEALAGGQRMREERKRSFASFQRRAQQFQHQTPGDRGALDIPAIAVMGALRNMISRHLHAHAEDQLPGRLDDTLSWLQAYARGPASEHWSTSPDAQLQLPAEDAGAPATGWAPERLPPGTHGLPAALIARHQRTRLINAIAEVTMHKGYADAKINDIVASARVAKPVFYRYFTGKQHAFLDAQQYPTQHILDRCAEAYYSAREWPERMWKLFDALTDMISANPAISHLRLVECYAAGPEAIRRAEQITRSFTIFLEEGYHQSTKAQELPRLASQAITGAIFEIIRRQIAQGKPHAPKAHLPQLTYIATAPFIGPEQSIAALEEIRSRQGA
jgi:AcrR family transcriptional regulator